MKGEGSPPKEKEGGGGEIGRGMKRDRERGEATVRPVSAPCYSGGPRHLHCHVGHPPAYCMPHSRPKKKTARDPGKNVSLACLCQLFRKN